MAYTTRARDGWGLRSGSRRRSIRKLGGLSNRQYKKVVKENRRYNKSKSSKSKSSWFW